MKVIKNPAFFNMSATFRFDSTFPLTYLGYQPLTKKITVNFDVILKPKRRLILWIVSHCVTGSNREEYIGQLKKYVQVCYKQVID